MFNNERYSRQILMPEIGIEGQKKLSASKVLIVGVGGLGSPIATYLAGAGVGCLGLIDADVVSVSNLHRQVLYSELEVGKYKALCAKDRLQLLNSEITINAYPEMLTADNAKTIISEYDIVVDGCDNFKTRFLINDTCVALSKPYVYGAICGLEGQVAVLCADSAVTYRTIYPDEQFVLEMPHPSKAVVGVTPAIVGSVEASETIKWICNYGDILLGKLWVIDLKTLQTNIIEL